MVTVKVTKKIITIDMSGAWCVNACFSILISLILPNKPILRKAVLLKQFVLMLSVYVEGRKEFDLMLYEGECMYTMISCLALKQCT